METAFMLPLPQSTECPSGRPFVRTLRCKAGNYHVSLAAANRIVTRFVGLSRVRFALNLHTNICTIKGLERLWIGSA